MSYTDLRDFECEYRKVFTGESQGEHEAFVVEIEKLGGGTVGNTYTRERWRYTARFSGGKEIMRGQDLYIADSASHEDAANAVFSMVCYTEKVEAH